MAAFRFALDAGAGGIETDVQASADGVAFLLHDEDLDRTTAGTGRADTLPFDALSRISAGTTGAAAFRDECIPSLADLAELCRGRARLVLDLKGAGTAEPIREALEQSGFPIAEVTVCTWTPEQFTEFRTATPAMPLAFIQDEPTTPTDPAWFADLAASGYHGLSLAWSSLSEDAIRQALLHDLEVMTWTVNERHEMDAALDAGIAAIITDHPGELVARIRARGW